METKATVTLPDDLLADILGRLPARSLAASQRVCKAWHELVKDRRLLLRLRRLLPHSVRGLFINYQDYGNPHFFARPPLAVAADGARIKGKVDFIVREINGYSFSSWYEVADHCNGILLYRDTDQHVLYVLNPATRRRARLPPCSGEDWKRRAFLVFDPAVSPDYKVLLEPVDLTDCKNDVRSFLGRSKEGVYFAAIDDGQLRVWKLSESNNDDEMRWELKRHSNLKTHSWWLHELKYDAPWIMDIRYKEESLQQDVCWNSDDDDIIQVSDDEEESCYSYVRFLGFHPYKEVVFLCHEGTAVACHLNSSKVHYLGPIHLGGIYNRGDRESFVYTPCLDWRLRAYASASTCRF